MTSTEFNYGMTFKIRNLGERFFEIENDHVLNELSNDYVLGDPPVICRYRIIAIDYDGFAIDENIFDEDYYRGQTFIAFENCKTV